ncbi:MAG: pilus assembly protein TadG-related protein [Alphaproteobacteria bacterium]
MTNPHPATLTPRSRPGPLRSCLAAGSALLRRFRRDQRGAVAATLAIWILPLVAATGVAVDSGRALLAKHRLTDALDAATLAAGRSFEEGEQDQFIEAFLRANFPDDYLGGDSVDYTLGREDDGTRLIASACVDMRTSFMAIVGFDDMTVCARSVVQRETRGMEIALVMDNTWSMNDNGKMGAMITAANALVNNLYGNNETVDDLYVAVVPYVAAVNVGNTRTGWLSNYNSSLYSTQGWRGCVEERDGARGLTDDPPSVQRFRQYYWQSGQSWYNFNNWPPIGGSQDYGPNKGCPAAITPLIQSKSQIHAAINAMTPRLNGTTSHVGLVWGWRVLSPRWRGLWTGSVDAANLPLDYDAENMEKVIILLTDGQNYWSGNGSYYNAHGYIWNGRLGTTSWSLAMDAMDTRTAQICENIKAEGIILYTILFQVNNPATDAMYEACATTGNHYYNSPTNADLQVAFRKIAGELSNLRIAE